MDTLEREAEEFATHAHGLINQRRKYTNEPYIVHPRAVVELVKSVPHTSEMIAAAWLHDVVEDTPIALEGVAEKFGSTVATLVEMLTDVSCPKDGNRAVRKAIDREHLSIASSDAKTIKLADLIDNTKTIVKYDPDFAKIYLAEKILLLEVLKDGDEQLWNEASKIALEGLAKLRNNV